MPRKGKSHFTHIKGKRKQYQRDTCVISNTNKITADVESQNAAATTAGSDAAPQKDSKEEKNAKNPRAEPSHPPTSVMVKSAIKGLKERGGSSLQAIKRYIADNYEADAEKLAPFIKKYIRGAVGSGILVQKKGKGASGSFRLASFADYRGSSSSRKKRKAKAAAAVSSSRRKKRKAGTAAAVDERSLSWKIFNAFATDTQLSLTEDEIKVYVTKDLGVAIDSIPMPVVEMLPTIVVAFMNMWSGWLYKSDFGDEFPKAHYYQWFRIYMKDKMSAIRGQYAMVSKSVEEQVKCIKVNSEKKATLDPDISPFSIYVECPAQMLNTIVFSNVGEDVIMKQHIATDWEDLSTTQLLNWPHVEVSFRTQDMCFVRRQATEYSRYLNFMPQESVKHTDVIIEEAKLLTEKENGRRCIGYEYLQKYLDVYMETIKNHKQITACKFDEIRTILSQFLEDVKFMDVNKSIATDTLVLFRLSPVPFIRNKKLVKNSDREKDEKRVAYCEIITPKIELVLLYFNAEQTDTPYLSFKYIENIKTQEKFTPVVPFISYKCTFCNVDFTGYESKQMIMEHLKKEHKMEQHMRCMPCKKQFNVLNLAACRWRHKCQMVETQK